MPLLKEMLESAQHEDAEFTDDLVHGFKVIGELSTGGPDLPIPAFLQKRQGWPKKGRDPGPKCKEKSKSLPFCPRSLHFCPKSLHFVFLKGSFDPQKGRDLKCKDLGQNARIFFWAKIQAFFSISKVKLQNPLETPASLQACKHIQVCTNSN